MWGVPLFVFYRLAIALEPRELHKDAYARLSTRPPMTSKSARGATDSSKTQVMTYPYHGRTPKPSPPTIYLIYPGQDSAWGSHTSSY